MLPTPARSARPAPTSRSAPPTTSAANSDGPVAGAPATGPSEFAALVVGGADRLVGAGRALRAGVGSIPSAQHHQLDLDQQLGRIAQLRQRLPEAAHKLAQPPGVPAGRGLLQ